MLFYVAGAAGLIWVLAWVLVYDRPEVARWLGEDERKLILTERNARITEADTATAPVDLLRLMGTRTLWGVALTQGCNWAFIIAGIIADRRHDHHGHDDAEADGLHADRGGLTPPGRCRGASPSASAGRHDIERG